MEIDYTRLGQYTGGHDPVYVPVDPDNRKLWLLQRKQGIGGSDTAAIMGLSNRAGPLAIYFDKRNPAVEDDPTQDEAAYWGHRLEEVCAQEFASRSGYSVVNPRCMFQHPEYPWLLATPDRFAVNLPLGKPAELAGVEIKTRSAFVADQFEGTLPRDVYCQVNHYMCVLGMDHYWVAVLVGGQKFMHARVELDRPFVEEIVNRTGEFWHKNVLASNPPPADASDDTTQAIKAAFPEGSPKAVKIDDVLGMELQRYVEINAELADLDKEKEAIANRARMALGEAEAGSWNGREVVTWKTGWRDVVDLPALYLEHAAWVEKHTSRVPQRRLSVSKKWLADA